MGKSSLRVRTVQRLQADGIVTVEIDVTEIGSTEVTQSEWYSGIIANQAKLVDFDLEDWWQQYHLLSPVHHFSKFIDEVLLEQITQNIVIFVDESDAIRRFSTDFFAMIRTCYNLRSSKRAYERLTFAILGVASPADLIADVKITPFNIGRAVDLTGFELVEAKPLEAGLAATVVVGLYFTLDWWAAVFDSKSV